MAQHVFTLDDRGFQHARETLSRYLPGLDPGLTPLSNRQALVPETTLTSLRLSYGAKRMVGVLRTAGVTGQRPVGDLEALQLLFDRNVELLPERTSPPSATPTWHLEEVDVRAAWNILGGPMSIAWDGVKVGQVDTGYTEHPAFGFGHDAPWLDVDAGRTFFAPGAGPGGPGPGDGVDPLEGACDGHGTRIGSVIAGCDPSASGGTYLGIAPKVPLVPVRIANDVFISHAQRELAEALDYLVQDVRVSVVNLSMGFLPRLQLGVLDDAIDRAYEAGVIFVCAAGQPLASVVSPAHGRRTIAAAGSTVGGIPWSQSAHGAAVDWSAPAEFIFRAETRGDGSKVYVGGGDGTSYATAISSGAAALWLAHHGPTIAQTYPELWQRIEAFKFVAKATARPMPHQQPGSFGAGILDIGALLQEPLPAVASLQKERQA
jgi:subtilase family protein